MIESIAQGYATTFLASAIGKICRSDRTNNGSTADRNPSIASGKNVGSDTLQLSAKGRLLAMNDLMPPTTSNMRKLSDTLSGNLKDLFRQSGVSTQTPIEINVDEKTMNITVKGERPDTEKISALINSDEKITQQIRAYAAISSHTINMTDPLKFQKGSQAGNYSGSVAAKYSALFDTRKTNDLSMMFDGNNIRMLPNGQQHLSSP